MAVWPVAVVVAVVEVAAVAAVLVVAAVRRWRHLHRAWNWRLEVDGLAPSCRKSGSGRIFAVAGPVIKREASRQRRLKWATPRWRWLR